MCTTQKKSKIPLSEAKYCYCYCYCYYYTRLHYIMLH